MFDDLVEECRSAMHHDNIDNSCSMVHDQQVEESMINMENRDVKRARSYKEGISMGKFKIQHKRNFNKIFSYKVPTKYTKTSKDRVSHRRSPRGKV